MHTERNDIPNDRLHDESFQRDGIVRVLVAFVEFQIVVENETALHVTGHCDLYCGSAGVVGENYGAVAFVGKV